MARSLEKHPLVTGLEGTDHPENEGQHVQSVYPPAHVFGGMGRFAFDPDAYMSENDPRINGAASRLRADWEAYWSDPRATFAVEKSPPNLLKMRFLQACFPDAVFVVVIRHPAAVALATRRQLVMSRDPRRRFVSVRRLIRHWLVAYKTAMADLPFLNQAIVVRYEDFVDHPQKVLDEIFSLARLPLAQVDVQPSSLPNRQYFEAWRLLPAATRYSCKPFESEVRQYGYSLVKL